MKTALVIVLFPVVIGMATWLAFRLLAPLGRKHRLVRLITGNLMILLFLISVAASAGEAYYRYDFDEPDAFGFARTTQRWYERHWKVNASGYRDTIEYADTIQPGKRRVTFIGDSFTAGHGITDVENRFVNRIRRAHPDWEVRLLAKPGWDTGGELDELKLALARGEQIDEIVLVYCLNDVADILPQWSAEFSRVMQAAGRQPWLVSHSYLANRGYTLLTLRREPDMRNYFHIVRTAYDGPLWERQQLRLDSLRRVVEGAGGHLSVVTFPFLQRLGSGYQYKDVHQALNRFWQSRGVPELDLLSVFANVPSSRVVVSRFDSHPNEYANRLAADAIDPFLRAQIANRPR